MREHLSTQDIEGFRQRTLTPADLLSADDHLATCETCRAQLGSTKQSRAATMALWADLQAEAKAEPDHLSYEQLEAYVDGQGNKVDSNAVKSHLAQCPQCEATVKNLQAVRREIERDEVIKKLKEKAEKVRIILAGLLRPLPSPEPTALATGHTSVLRVSSAERISRWVEQKLAPPGSPSLSHANLIEDEDLSDEELAELERMMDELKSEREDER